MLKKRKKKGDSVVKKFKERRTYSQKLADDLAVFAGSWAFIISLVAGLIIWIILNVVGWSRHWDIYPFILLNFVLSCVAALIGPVILMSQNREAEVSKKKTELDYRINRKAEREITDIQKDLEEIKRLIKNSKRKR